jgi:hypothetical protein
MRRFTALSFAAALLLSGCGSAEPAAESAPGEPTTAGTESDPAGGEGALPEGPVSEGPHQWPDGLAAEVVTVESRPAETVDDPALDTEVRVTVQLTNTGSEVVSLGADPNGLDAGPDDELFYGGNRYEAQGWYNDANNLPTQLAPGTSASWVSVFTLPGTELGVLAYSFSPTDAHGPWTFTELESLLPA